MIDSNQIIDIMSRVKATCRVTLSPNGPLSMVIEISYEVGDFRYKVNSSIDDLGPIDMDIDNLIKHVNQHIESLSDE